MYIAYGSALYSGKASTNLHIDMSDAVNCLVYVGFPSDGNPQENAKEVFKEVDKAGMFALTPLTILACVQKFLLMQSSSKGTCLISLYSLVKRN